MLKGNAIVLVANGPGPKLAAHAVDIAREREKLEGLVSIGFCGALDPTLAPCDIFVATEVVGVGMRRTPARLGPAGPTSMASCFPSTASPPPSPKKPSSAKCGADVVEMEAAAVAERAEHCNLPFYAIRVVTDTADENFPLDFNHVRDAEGRFDRVKILRGRHDANREFFPR